MFKTVRNALKIKDIRNKLLYTFVALIIVRIGCQLPAPGVNRSYVAQFFTQQMGGTGTAMNFFDAMTGGSFTTMSIFALNITPYITSSIIMQLLTIAIPRLEELQKDGEDGRKKITEYTRYLTIALAIIESLSMAIGFGNQGYLEGGLTFTNAVIVVVSMTAGASYLMWLGEQITDKGVGNGISIILLINIISKIPSDLNTLFAKYVKGNTIAKGGLAAVVIIAILVAMVVMIVILSGGERRIPVQYAKKMQGRKMVGGQSTNIPLKVNTAGVIPVIFAGSLLSFPIVIARFAGIEPASGASASVLQKLLKVCNQNAWFNLKNIYEFKYTLGLVAYIVLVIFLHIFIHQLHSTQLKYQTI